MKSTRPLFQDDLNPDKEYCHTESDFANWQHAHYVLEGYRARVVGIVKNPYPQNGQRNESFQRGWNLADRDLGKASGQAATASKTS